MGYLLLKSSKFNSSDTIYIIAEGNKGFHSFPKGISPKINIVARLEIERT